MHITRIALALGVSTLLAACAGARFDVAASTNDERVYTSLYPIYAEYCAISQIKKRPGLEPDTSGGIGGHAVLYLNGVCRDTAAKYPTIRICDAARDTDHDGVGISINAHFKNANWVATPGRDFFFRGGLGTGKRVTLPAYRTTQVRARELGILDGIEYHPEVFNDLPVGMSRYDFMYEMSVATDYAVEMARDRYCARVPLHREQMARAVNYLNGLNTLYRDGRRDFVWSVFRDNCIHGLHNALAAAGVWEEWPANRNLIISALDFPVPKNEFVNLARRTNDLPLDDPYALYRDDAARRSLTDDETIPTGPGSLASAVPAIADNEIYDPDVKLIFYDEPLLGRYEGQFRQIFLEPRYTDLRANLSYFRGVFERTISQRHIIASRSPRAVPVGMPDELGGFFDRFYRYVERQLGAVNAGLEGLVALKMVSN